MNPKLTRAARVVADRVGLDAGSARAYLALKRAELKVDVSLCGAPGRVAIVGCGAQGSTIALAVDRLEGWTVTDLFDIAADAALRLRERTNPRARVHTDVDSLLAYRDDFDIVVIATTAPSHHGLARACIEGGVRSLLIEKPVTTSLADADELVALASQHGCRVVVDHTRRYMPSVPGLQRLLAAGTVGSLRAVYFFMGSAGLAMMGTHLFDLARWLTGSEVARVRAELDPAVDPHGRGADFCDHVGRAEAVMSDGTRLVLDLSAGLELRQSAMVLACEQGRIEVDERLGLVRLVGSGKRVWESPYLHKGTVIDGIARALLELAEGKPPRCGVEDGRAALEAVVGCHASHRQGSAWVELPVAGDVRAEQFAFA